MINYPKRKLLSIHRSQLSGAVIHMKAADPEVLV